jgi:hypothetical protein
MVNLEKEKRDLQMLMEQRRSTAFFWSVQVDAAAGVEDEGGA